MFELNIKRRSNIFNRVKYFTTQEIFNIIQITKLQLITLIRYSIFCYNKGSATIARFEGQDKR